MAHIINFIQRFCRNNMWYECSLLVDAAGFARNDGLECIHELRRSVRRITTITINYACRGCLTLYLGRKRNIPHLWAYAFISQILPVSFAQNLFFLAVLLKPLPNPNEKIWTPTPVLQLLPLLGYYLFVLAAPYVAGTGAFVGVVVVIRLLLFCPLILPTLVAEGGGQSYLTPRKSHWADATPVKFIAICTGLLWTLQIFMVLRENGPYPDKFYNAIHDSPAVSALSYDYILSIVSFGAWNFAFRTNHV